MKILSKALLASLKKDPIETLGKLSDDDIAFVIQKANYEYFNTDHPIISDQLYDVIKEYLQDKNPNHPILKSTGAAVGDDVRKEALPYFLGSLDKIKTDDKVLSKWITSHAGSYVLSDKLDGNSALLVWKDCQLKLYSRGDGSVGQNISHLLSFIRHVPHFKGKEEVAVRGEIIISKKDFETVKSQGANARNMVAGLLNAKIPDLKIAALSQFVAYEVISPKLSPGEQYKKLTDMGFKTAHSIILPEINLDILSNTLMARRDVSEFEIDGIVVSHNKVYKRVRENPSYAFAFKSVHTMQKAEVTVTHVEWNMSKDGYLIPVVNFQDVRLAGVVIKRAHGFNGKFIKDNVIGPGSRITIMRSGDVIPYILDVLSPSETGAPQMPDVDFEWSKSKVDIVIATKEESSELKYKNLEYFFSKIDVKGLGPGNVKKMYDSGLTSVRDIFRASKQDLLKVASFKDKTAENLLAALKEAKSKLTCIRIMDASNAFGRGIGSKKIQLILDHFPSVIQTRMVPSLDELVHIKGIEKTTAEQFIDRLPRVFEFIDDNELLCGEPQESQHVEHLDLLGQKIVFTGFRDSKLEAHIKSRGGDVSSGVSKHTTLVIKKDTEENSTKIQKAKLLGIRIVNLSDFKKDYKIPA